MLPRFRHALLPFLLASVSFAQGPQGVEEPPAANRPEPFSGAVGRRFVVTMHADRKELQAGDPLLLTVRVAAEGSWQRAPHRPDLRRHERYARFPRSFHVENAGENHDAENDTWEFVYRLRPLSESVTEVPRLPWVYYRPGQGYQTLSAPPIKLRVEARRAVSAAEVQGAAGPVPAADVLYQLTEGANVLRREDPGILPTPTLALLALVVPPLGCASWYVLWRRRNPEEARLTQLRRGRAARTALDALQRIVRQAVPDRARACALVLADYLRERFGLPAAEPTPAEVAAHLRQAGVAAGTADDVAGFFRACDRVRFAGGFARASDNEPATARQHILDLEAAACSSRAS